MMSQFSVLSHISRFGKVTDGTSESVTLE